MARPFGDGVEESVVTTETRRAFDVWNEVPLVAQTTGMSCWAAAAAMLVGWRERLAVNPDDVARGAGRWSEFKNGLHPENVGAFAERWRLVSESPDDVWDVDRFRALLESHGPLWVGEASPGLHAIVVTGIYGDGTPDGTSVRVNDPWPVGGGERYTISFQQLRDNFDAASRLTGDRAHILHSGGRARGSSGHWRSEERSLSRVARKQTIGDAMTRYGRATLIDAEALDVRAGDRYIDTTRGAGDPLAGHGGTGENLYLTWNAIPETATSIDVVVHLHGYSPLEPNRAMLEKKVAASGLDLAGRTRPTLAILPRGRKITQAEIAAERQAGRSPNTSRYTFPALIAQQGIGLERLIQYALTTLGREVLGGRTLHPARLIITVHSGAGAALEDLLRHHTVRAACNPHEVHIYDALYSASPHIATWARAHVAADAAFLGKAGGEQTVATDGGGCRVIYGAGTQAHSLDLARAFPSSGPLRAAYRAESTRVAHGDIPRAFGRALLTSVRADLVVVPARAKELAMVTPLDVDVSTEAAADDARAWLTADESTRTTLESRVRPWVLATDRSAIELLPDAAKRRHFLTEVNWQHEDFPGNGPHTSKATALFSALAGVVPERRVPSNIRFHDVDTVVVTVPGNGAVKLFPEAKDAFVRMRDAASAEGVTLTILSGWRSRATQNRIKSGNKNPNAVAQGVSAHSYGLAIDVAMSVPGLHAREISTKSMPNMVAMYRSPAYKWMALNARRFGWFPYKQEPWHWEYNPDGFKARFEAAGKTAAALAYGAPSALFEAYAPTESLDVTWEDAIFRAIHGGERRINTLLKISRDAGAPNDTTARRAVLQFLRVPFPKGAQRGGITCEQNDRTEAKKQPDTPRIVFTGRYESKAKSGHSRFWAINQAGNTIIAIRTLRGFAPPDGDLSRQYLELRGDVQADGTAVLFDVNHPDRFWGYLQQQPNRKIVWHHGSYLGADGKRVFVEGAGEKDEELQLSEDNRPTMMESLFKSDDNYMSVLLQEREWYPLMKTTYEFLQEGARADLLRDLLTEYLNIKVVITYKEREAKQTAGALITNFIGHLLWDGAPATEPMVHPRHPRLKEHGERARRRLPHGHHNNAVLATHVAKMWLAHEKLNHEGEKRSFLDWLTKIAQERQDQALARFLDIPAKPSSAAGTHRYHMTLTVASIGFWIGYAEGHLRVEKLTEPRWPGTGVVAYDVTAGTLGKPKLPERDEVFDLVVTTPLEWSVDDFEGTIFLGEVSASVGMKYVKPGATVMGGYLRSKNGQWIAFEDADAFVKPGKGGSKQSKPKVKVRAEGMIGKVRRHRAGIIDLSKPYAANVKVAGQLLATPHFCFGSSQLTPAARQLLRVVCADQLAALTSPTSDIWIIGHTDRPDKGARNIELSQLRAKNVKIALTDILGDALKVPDDRIHDVGLGEWLAFFKLRNEHVKVPEDRRVDLLINGSLVATFKE
jgi:outer membrane protein OmpA-like peptidoglycan-associated protein